MSGTVQQLEYRCEQFFRDSQDQDGLASVARLRQLQSEDAYRVSVVGGFSKGKTHLVNALLGTDILPEDILPTTTVLTEVRYGSMPELAFHSEAGVKSCPCTTEAIAAFSADGPQADAVGTLSLALPNALLQPDLMIYDTPGVDDLLTNRANVTFAALESCDAALIAVSAVSPLSLSEKAFIDSYVYDRSLAQIALVINFMDNVPDKDQARQIEFIKSRAHKLYPDVEIWCSQELENSAVAGLCHVAGTEGMRQRLREWRQNPHVQKLRDRRCLQRLATAVQSSVGRTENLLANLQGDIVNRRSELLAALHALDPDNETWNTLRSSFLEKSLTTKDVVIDKIHDLAARLHAQANENDRGAFVATLHQQLQSAVAELETIMQRHLEADISALQNEIGKLQGTQNSCFAQKKITANAEQYINNIDVADIFNDVFDLVMGGLDAITAFVPNRFRKFALLGKLLLGSARKFFTSRLGDQLHTAIDAFCQEMQRGLSLAMSEAYAQIAEAVRQQQQAWMQEQREQLTKAHGMGDLEAEKARLEQLLARGRELLKELPSEVHGA